MADSTVTLYPGDTLTITVSTGQEPDEPVADPGPEPDEPVVDHDPGEVIPDGTPEVEPVAFTPSGDVDPGPLAGDAPSPVEHG